MSEHIIDGKVIPFDGGRKSRDTRTWRDATDLEIQQAERIAELEAALDSHPAIDLSKLHAALKDPHCVHALMLRGDIAKPSWRAIVDLMGEVPNGEEVQLARIAELQHQVSYLLSANAARPAGEAVAWLHDVVQSDGEQDQALSFSPDSFPLEVVGGFESIKSTPLFLAPQARKRW